MISPQTTLTPNFTIMLTKIWKVCHGAVCSLNFLNERGVVIDTLTGFKVGKSLITSEHAFYIPKARKVEIAFVAEDANTVTAIARVPYREFVRDMRIGVMNNHADYAIFNIDIPDFEHIPGLTLSERRTISIGQQVAMLAFCGGSANLALRTGIVASLFANKEGVRYMQFDGLTCYGNSGAPLIDLETMQVIGIISRRNTPAIKAYQKLQEIIAANLEELRKVENVVRFGDMDPVQVLIANQNQLKNLVSNIYRYTSTGTSQAVMLDQILSYFSEKVMNEPMDHLARIDANYQLS